MGGEKKKLRFRLLLLLTFLAGAQSAYASEYILASQYDPPSIIVCRFSKGIYIDPDNGEFNTSVMNEKPFEIVISEPFGDRPVMKGNVGETELVKLGAGQGVVYLLELTEAGNINYITLFIKNKMVVFSKQYLPPSGVPIVMTLVGRYR
jgi:hypothetical protein